MVNLQLYATGRFGGERDRWFEFLTDEVNVSPILVALLKQATDKDCKAAIAESSRPQGLSGRGKLGGKRAIERNSRVTDK